MLIDGLLEDGETERCLKQIKAMEENGFEPNVKTYTALIRELCKENKNFEAELLINKMLEKGLVPEKWVPNENNFTL